jgi:hypothetical protein
MYASVMRYVRFVVATRDPDTGLRQGVFQAAATLARAGRLLPHEEEEVVRLRTWFNDRLPKPERFARSQNPRVTRGLSWFKDTAEDHLQYVRELIAILEAHDVRVDMIWSERPGYIVYVDEVQIVAEPFAETGT